MFDLVWNIGAFIIALGVLITFHEWGHFWVARRCGVKVLRFSIGFGKPIWRRLGKDGTEYVIAMIPLGGYVRMLDERMDDVSSEQQSQAFNRKPVLQRIAIVAAGPLANFVFAIFAFWLMYLVGVPSIRPVVGEVVPGSIAEAAGIEPGLEISAVNGRATLDWEEVNLGLVSAIGHDSMQITQSQPHGSEVATRNMRLEQWQFDPEKMSAPRSLGIVPFTPEIKLVLAQVAENSPAARGGLEVGDKLLTIEGSEITSWKEFVEIVAASAELPLVLQVERQGKVLERQVTPENRAESGEPSRGYLGIAPEVGAWPENYRIDLRYGPFGSLLKGLEKTWQLMELSVAMIGKLLTGDVSVKHLSGPISIAQGAGASAGFGFVYFLGFLALISVNLGIINLLPLPVLDGGHLTYYLIEAVTGRPVPERVQEIGFRVGSLLLLLIMAVALLNDISRL